MLPDRVSNPGPLTYESGALPIALRGPAPKFKVQGYLSFLLYLHNRVELCVKLYVYMSVYICQVSNIVCIPGPCCSKHR